MPNNKAVLLSIRPEWCEKILSGEKTVEIRKSCPAHGTPFKVYIYCTKAQSKIGWLRIVPGKGWLRLDSAVIGEFTCKKNHWIDPCWGNRKLGICKPVRYGTRIILQTGR